MPGRDEKNKDALERGGERGERDSGEKRDAQENEAEKGLREKKGGGWERERDIHVAGSCSQKRVHFTTNDATPTELTSDLFFLPSFVTFDIRNVYDGSNVFSIERCNWMLEDCLCMCVCVCEVILKDK